MHTDRRGSFGVALRPHADDLGHETFVARAGCEARLETDVTAADLPEPCPDPADSSTPAVDGPAYRAAVAEDRPAHWWPLDDTGDVAADTATTAGGSGGPGADPGTYVGRAVHAARSALSDGGSTYFDFVFPDPISIDLAHPVEFDADFTFELWAYMCGYIDFEYPVLGMTDDNLRFDWGPGKLRLLDGRFELAMADTTVPTGSWHHWLITRRDGSLQIYFDGVPDGWGTDANWRDPIAVARIGNANPDTGTGFFDEVAIYDYALSPERVAAHANP
jgi:hypothetical protein